MNAKIQKNILPKDVRHRAIALLNRQLADALDLRLRAKQALWNVQGTKFGSLQELCNQVSRATRDASEILARRAVELGGVAEATIQGIAHNSRLGLHPITLTRAPDQLWAFCGAFVQYTASVREAIKAADLICDYDTGDLFILISRAADRLLWKIGANLCESWDSTVPPTANPIRTPVSFAEIPCEVRR